MFAKLIVAVLLASLAAAQPVRDWRSLRYEGVVGQSDWFTCGPAAVATLLRHYYGMEGVDEEQVLALALRFMGKTEAQVRPSGITALAQRISLSLSSTLGWALDALRFPSAGLGLRTVYALEPSAERQIAALSRLSWQGQELRWGWGLEFSGQLP
jgi:hypothetical protein